MSSCICMLFTHEFICSFIHVKVVWDRENKDSTPLASLGGTPAQRGKILSPGTHIARRPAVGDACPPAAYTEAEGSLKEELLEPRIRTMPRNVSRQLNGTTNHYSWPISELTLKVTTHWFL